MEFREPKDATELFEIAKDAYQEKPWPLESFERDLASRHTHYLVLEEHGEPVAFVGGTLIIDELSISNVAVKSAFQGRGLGQLLLMEWFNQFPPGTRILLEVRVSNEVAQHVYQKLGFNVYHRRKDYYHNPVEDALLMDYFL
ncbi:ribosomal-protein-alanine N-acetyltransferase [Weissella uvarum]|uniref:ribosomal protein S18-alanine N-acetyltransferase n=1 Tax=Weissella uvarum TaxID=1479233 RepID=UPI001960C01A|nr:ribosomal protein S18-alanine N-acetyltransferase [Weissella uvarum]MBM7616786.1 ribosomal-protein-alanine N-acetyltransferase [Weissella uvarum]MCM0594760.1 ribosomal protein S18-alanine N-acetyltransferase [Weissella uvarum]